MQESFRQFLDRLRQSGELVDLHQPVDIRHIATLVTSLRVELTPLKRGSPKPSSIRRRQSQGAPGIREQPRPKADKDRKFIVEPHFAGRKSLM